MIDRVVTSGDDGVRTYSVGKGRINVDSADALTALKALFSADYSNFLKENEESEQACQELGVSVSFSGEGELSRPFGVGNDCYVHRAGRVPAVHCISSNADGTIWSVLQTRDLHKTAIETDMTKWHAGVPKGVWVRLTETFNHCLGREACKFVNNSLQFGSLSDKERQAYLLYAEAFLTPKGYERVWLLSGVDEKFADLLAAVDGEQTLVVLA